MTKVILCGANGRMGRVIAEIIEDRADMVIVAGVDKQPDQAIFPVYPHIGQVEEEADCVIDFSHPSLLEELLEYAVEKNLSVVLCATGYSEEQLARVETASKQIPVFRSANMSLGVNLLIDLAKKAANVLGSDFDIEIVEKHHNQKIDAPSGTAYMIADAINEERDNRHHCVYDRQSRREKRDPSEIGIHAVRGGTIVGEHEVIFAGRDESISIRHAITSREVFAVGAVNAAGFLAGKPAGLYQMKDLIGDR